MGGLFGRGGGRIFASRMPMISAAPGNPSARQPRGCLITETRRIRAAVSSPSARKDPKNKDTSMGRFTDRGPSRESLPQKAPDLVLHPDQGHSTALPADMFRECRWER
jgi:hypothetical protein